MMKAMNEFNLIVMCDTLLDYGLITEQRKSIIIKKNRKREQ